jgi:hypothetical protein
MPGVHVLRYYSTQLETPEDPDLTLRVGSGSDVGGGLAASNAVLTYDLQASENGR